MDSSFDLLVIGGGVNGASIARAAAVAGHRTLLVEQGDLAQATSSASTKLMHGGLRYLERLEFKLVRESLSERAIMLRTAPHIVRPLQFLLPHNSAMRPWLMVRAGLLLYDALALGGGLPRSRSAGLKGGRMGRRGFAYWDGRVDDSRLVVLNALDAFEAGATIMTRARMAQARRHDGGWQVKIERADGQTEAFAASAIVNAAGPWVAKVLRDGFGRQNAPSVRLVRGSHIVIARKPGDDRAFLLQQPDGRIVFAIPYEDELTLIGTTDMPVAEPGDAVASDEEIAYLLAAANRYLEPAITPSEIVWRYAGIRALHDDGSTDPSALTRDYRFELDDNGPPLLSVYGGKITTARHLADRAMKRLGLCRADTSDRFLPGGDIGPFEPFLAEVRQRWPFLGDERSTRVAHAYGSRIGRVLAGAEAATDLGRDFGHGLTEREVAYLHDTEWARSAEDILWRRSKLGLRFSADEADALDRHVRALHP